MCLFIRYSNFSARLIPLIARVRSRHHEKHHDRPRLPSLVSFAILSSLLYKLKLFFHNKIITVQYGNQENIPAKYTIYLRILNDTIVQVPH